MIVRCYVIGITILYFYSWGHFSNWDIDHALFVDWDVHPNGMGTALRLGVGSMLFLASLFSIATIGDRSKK